MAYGTVISYEYEEEVTEKLPNGETKTHIEKKKNELVFNAFTPIKYLNYTGRDLYDDMVKITKRTLSQSTKESNAVLNKAQTEAEKKELTISDFTDEDFKALKNLNYTEYAEFFINLFASMVAAGKYHQELDFADIIVDLPIDLMLSDQDLLKRTTDLLGFGLKKKTATVYRRTAIN